MTNKQTIPEQAYGNQAQLTLVTWCLLRYRDALVLSYEREDDIAIVQNDNSKLFIQVKSGKTNPLSDSSPELWKTILNWTTQCTIRNNEQFIILITRNHEYGNFCSKILEFQKNQDFQSLHLSLRDFFSKTKNKEIKKIINNYLYASDRLKHIFSRIQIVLTQNVYTHESIEKELALYHEQEGTVGPLKDRLMGWVQKEIEKQSILNPKEITICNTAFSIYHANLRTTLSERLKYNLTPPSITNYQKERLLGNTFIRQLDAINVNNTVKDKAITDFLTAEKFLDDMIHDGTIIDEEIQEERRDLKDFWFNITIQPSMYNDEQRGKEVYSTCMNYRSSPLYMKALKKEIFQGTYHMLADEIAVWWHPNFESISEE